MVVICLISLFIFHVSWAQVVALLTEVSTRTGKHS